MLIEHEFDRIAIRPMQQLARGKFALVAGRMLHGRRIKQAQQGGLQLRRRRLVAGRVIEGNIGFGRRGPRVFGQVRAKRRTAS